MHIQDEQGPGPSGARTHVGDEEAPVGAVSSPGDSPTESPGDTPAESPGDTPAAREESEALRASLRRRLHVMDLPPSRIAWAGAMALFGLALVLRLWGLGSIHELIFDETYYVKDGYTLTQEGVEMSWPDEPDPAFEAGDVDTYLPQGAYVVHPPLGKWLIGAGMMVLGPDNPWGWRISSALGGALAVLLLARIGRRLFRSTTAGMIAGLLLAIDGVSLVHSRTSLLDPFLMLFALAAFGALLIDRDRFRERLALAATQMHLSAEAPQPLGPGGGLRPWRLLAGLLLGMACAVKWSGLYFVAVFGIMTVLWDWWARRTAGQKDWLLGGFVRDAVPAFFAIVGTALVTYVASFAGWFASSVGYNRRLAAAEHVDTGSAIIDSLHSLWLYHVQAYTFHVGLHSEHPYQSHPAGWLLQLRPTNFYYRSYEYGEHGCQVAKCGAQILSIGNPVIWWLGTLAILVALVLGIAFRDGRAWAALSGIAAGYLPWLMYTDRTVFTFYVIAFSPWLILCLAYVMSLVIGPPEADRDRRLAGGLFVGSLLVLIVLVSAFFWPVWTGQVIDVDQWRYRIWLPSWS